MKALANPEYYRRVWKETAVLRLEMVRQLRQLGLDVVDGSANFLLCHLPEEGPDAQALVGNCRRSGIFLRDLSSSSLQLGDRAIRIAVKDAKDNDRAIKAIATALDK